MVACLQAYVEIELNCLQFVICFSSAQIFFLLCIFDQTEEFINFFIFIFLQYFYQTALLKKVILTTNPSLYDGDDGKAFIFVIHALNSGLSPTNSSIGRALSLKQKQKYHHITFLTLIL